MPAFPEKLLAATLALAALAPTRACGPGFPNAYLAEGSVNLLNAPEGYFAAEIARLAPAKPRADSKTGALIAAANAAKRANELTETGVLRLALARRGCAPARIDALAAELETVRASIFSEAWHKIPAFSKDMPAEFALYLNGAFAYWKGDDAGARDFWTQLLALPENERRHYTVNATYMLGRGNFPGERITPMRESTWRNTSRQSGKSMTDAATWFRKTREAAAAGFDDISGLADASLGWEARAWLDIGDYAKAIHLYARQYAANGAKSAIQSLRIVAGEALAKASGSREPGDTTAQCLQALAQDELSRRVITVFLLARFGATYWEPTDAAERQIRAWAGILQKASLRNVPDTDRLAWLAYQAGYFDMARDWLDLAPDDSVPANWIRAKLALRAGDLAGGEDFLEKVTAASDLAGEARPVAWSELGRVRMSRGKYTSALDAFLRGGHWEDSAYIAERVLTLDELQSYVDQCCPEYVHPGENSDPHDYFWKTSEAASRNALRHLLARRLARANQPGDAVKYLPDDYRETYTNYIAGVREGFDASLPAGQRARALWRAALAIHENGMELLGTELAPDYFIWGGSYEGSSIAAARKDRLRLESGPVAPTAGELSRLEKSVVPQKRFHYRYRAAELGMWAASLMPNDDDETARILDTAGSWLKNRDPKEANTFYHALVIRCPNTALGRQAAARKWFP